MKDEIVVIGALRTPIGAFGGSLRDLLGVDMATLVVRELLKQSGFEERKDKIGDIIFGELAIRTRDEANISRIIGWRLGIPEIVPGMTIQRACASGLQAIITGAQEIMVGQCEVVIAGGTESMTNAPYELYGLRWGKRLSNEEIYDSMYAPLLSLPPTGTGMGMTAEILADRFGIEREEMDRYALSSHELAKRATDEGYFKEEIVPVPIKGSKKEAERIFEKDECIRETSLEKLRSLPPVFKKDGKITAGNACPISDGAAAVMLTKRSIAESLGIKPLGRLVGYAVVGVHPDLMGYGPVPATKKALEISGLSLKDIEVFEVNEAFAPIPLVFMKELGIPRDVLNVNGGAIALGHPIGATGARLVVTLLHLMKKRGIRRGLIGICQGSGMGTATIWESID